MDYIVLFSGRINSYTYLISSHVAIDSWEAKKNIGFPSK